MRTLDSNKICLCNCPPPGVSSFGDDMCTCGETGGCDGGKAEKCNCDEADARRRKDGGKIVNVSQSHSH